MPMNKLFKAALIAAGVCAAAAAAAVVLTAPGKADEEKKKLLYGRNVAHRGLHDDEKPENSVAAFRAAGENGYGTELDARLTADGEVVVLHDDSTRRMCGTDLKASETSLAQLQTLRLRGTDEHIPTLREALAAVDGRGPVILELKTAGKNNPLLCEKVLSEIRLYGGPLCIESFDPRIVAWFRRSAPEILRGQLTDSFRRLKEGISPPAAFAIANGLTNVIARPQFIAHGPGRKSPLIRLAEKLGAMDVYWTSHDYNTQWSHDAVIFEYYRPRPCFKKSASAPTSENT